MDDIPPEVISPISSLDNMPFRLNNFVIDEVVELKAFTYTDKF